MPQGSSERQPRVDDGSFDREIRQIESLARKKRRGAVSSEIRPHCCHLRNGSDHCRLAPRISESEFEAHSMPVDKFIFAGQLRFSAPGSTAPLIDDAFVSPKRCVHSQKVQISCLTLFPSSFSSRIASLVSHLIVPCQQNFLVSLRSR